MAEWTFQSHWKGLFPYEQALQFQTDQALQISQGTLPDQILGLEHPYVITLGKRSKLDPEIPPGPTVWVDRGGEATIHSPGQLVIYPLVKLRPHFELKTWVEFLHQVTERTLLKAGLQVSRGDQSGLWTDQGKIAFLGLRIKNGVSLHGLSINVGNDLNLFNSVKACGVKKAPLDSFQNKGLSTNCESVFQLWMEEFRRSKNLTLG